MKSALVLASLASLASAATTLNPINVTGNAFFDTKTGDRFFIRGVDYQPGGSSNLTDPLGDVSICSRDIPYFKDLGLNTIRVYSVDNTLDHSECMQQLADAGIYLILDVTTPGTSISQSDPGCSYNADFLQNIFATVDAFANYTNLLGFFAGNEVINNEDTLFTAPYVKATVRDLKKYIKARDYREIPVGYSAADISSVRLELAQYLNCGNDSYARVDMLGVNDYSWCGDSSFTQSGYSQKVKLYTGFDIPIFLSEFGCNEVVGTRPFTEIKSIYSTQMSSVFSGGLVYEYSEQVDKFGLVDISSSGVKKLPDYYNLQSELNSTTNPSGGAGFSTSNSIQDCPTDWNFTAEVPTTPSGAEIYFKDGAGDGLGFEGDTQDSCDDDAVYITTTSKSASASSTTKASKSKATSSARATSSAKSMAKSSISSSATSSTSVSSTSSKSSKGEAGHLEHYGLFSSVLAFAALFL